MNFIAKILKKPARVFEPGIFSFAIFLSSLCLANDCNNLFQANALQAHSDLDHASTIRRDPGVQVDLDHLSTIRKPPQKEKVVEEDLDATVTGQSVLDERARFPQLQEEFKIRRENYLKIKGQNLRFQRPRFRQVENDGKRSQVFQTTLDGKDYYYRPWQQKNADVGRYNLAAAEVAQSIGLPHLAPESKLIRTLRNGMEDFGVLTEAVPGQKGVDVLSREGYLPNREAYEEAQIFTHLIANLDHHGNNFTISDDGKFHFFDFDLSFGASFDEGKRKLRVLPKDKYQNEASEFIYELGRLPRDIDPKLREKVKGLRHAQLDALSPSELKELHRRLDEVLSLPLRETQIFSSAMPELKLKYPDMDMMHNGKGKESDVYAQVTSPVQMLEAFKAGLKRNEIDLSKAPRIRDNLEVLEWGAKMNLLDAGIFNQNPHAAASKNKVRVFLKDSSDLSSWIHELDHATLFLQKVRDYLKQKGVPDNPDAISQHFAKHDISEAIRSKDPDSWIQMLERYALRSERQGGKPIEAQHLIYPVTESVRRDLKIIESAESSPELREKLKDQVVVSLRKLFEKNERLKFWILRKGPVEQRVLDDVLFEEPKDLELSREWLEKFVRLSGSRGRSGLKNLETLEPLMQKAWQEYKIPRMMLEP